MNFSLAREIFGNGIWAVDNQALSGLMAMLNSIKGSGTTDTKEEKLNAVFLVKLAKSKSEIRSIAVNDEFFGGTKIVDKEYQISANSKDDYIAVTHINGVVTKNGGQSTNGMKQISAQLLNFDANSNVIGHAFITDSGGGSVDGMDVITHTMDLLTKPKVGLIERGGVAGSAAYGILAHTDWIISDGETNRVGSIGMVRSFSGHPDKAIDGNGEKHVTMYATASTEKNKWYEDAINKDDYTAGIAEIDARLKLFQQDMRALRPNILESHLNGSAYNAGDVVGTLVDEIGGFDAAVKYIQGQQKGKLISKNKDKAMLTAAEFKAENPAGYQEIFAEGIKAGINAEKDRTGAWMAHLETDAATVKAGIEGGGKITDTARETLLVKANSITKLDKLKEASAAGLTTPEAASEDVVPTEAEAFYAGVLGNMGIKTLGTPAVV